MNGKFGKAAIVFVLAVLVATGLNISFTPPAAAQGRGAARPQVLMPDGPVRSILRKNCTACHGIDDYAFYAQDRAAWQSMIESKHKTSGGADLAAQDMGLILDWLATKFGPTTKPFPRSYIPPEITTFFSDPEARRLINRACTACHPLDRIDKARYPADKWRVVAVDMRERGAIITDEEVERLVEWLARTHGTNQDQ